MSKEIKNGGPAFPINPDTNMSHNGEVYPECMGMTLRDYFAAKALAEAIADYGRNNEHPHKKGDRLLPHECKALGSREDIIAKQAYRYADAMLKAREE